MWLSGKRKAFPFGSFKYLRTSVGDSALKPKQSELPVFHETEQERITSLALRFSETKVTILDPKDDDLLK